MNRNETGTEGRAGAGAETGAPAAGAAAGAYLAARRAETVAGLAAICARRGAELESVLPGGAALLELIRDYAARGKMLRGGLVYLGAALAGRPRVPSLGDAAAAMEFFQAGLLIHDDIMDRDERRRGGASVHSSYAAEGRSAGAADPAHLGASLAICAGDVCFFEALRALSSLASGAGSGAAPILALCGEELSVVGLAQMADCRFGELPAEPSEEEILAMYRGKTARYSFSLPLALGAALGGRLDLREAVFAIGDLAGLAFQLRDDEIGIFGDPERTGKILGSDIRENKKTIWRARLLARAGGEEGRRLRSLYGKADLSAVDLEYLRYLTVSLGVRAELEAWRESLLARAKELVLALPDVDLPSRELLLDLIDWLVHRTH